MPRAVHSNTRRRGVWLAAAGLALAMLVPAVGQGQNNRQAPAIDDHRNVMRLFGVRALRLRPNPDDPSTFDEAEGSPYKDSMPDALRLRDGTRVTKPGQWARRRAKIAEEFEREVYGRIPDNVAKVTGEVTATKSED